MSLGPAGKIIISFFVLLLALIDFFGAVFQDYLSNSLLGFTVCLGFVVLESFYYLKINTKRQNFRANLQFCIAFFFTPVPALSYCNFGTDLN
jgi:hypothetical protein